MQKTFSSMPLKQVIMAMFIGVFALFMASSSFYPRRNRKNRLTKVGMCFQYTSGIFDTGSDQSAGKGQYCKCLYVFGTGFFDIGEE